jgi:Derlin-2/3
MEVWNAVPALTRTWGLLIWAAGACVRFRWSPARFLFFDARVLFRGRQLWRLLTCPFCMWEIGMGLVFHVVTTFYFIGRLESRHYKDRKSQMVFTFLVIEVFTVALSAIWESADIASSMAFAFVWIYSKLYSTEQAHFFFFANLPMQYFPLAMVALMLYYGQSLRSTILGLIVGHIVFYLLFVLPVIINRPILKTPRILKRLFSEIAPRQANT